MLTQLPELIGQDFSPRRRCAFGTRKHNSEQAMKLPHYSK